jgi:hypothetical protein
MPEAGHHHVLDAALFAISEFHGDFVAAFALAGFFAAAETLLLGAFTGRFPALGARARWCNFAGARATSALVTGFGCNRFTIPFGVLEVMMRFDEIIDREVVLAIVESSATTDDLLELDHRIHRAQQHDVTHIAGIDARGEFL